VLRERLPALRREGGEEGAHQGGGRPDHRLADGYSAKALETQLKKQVDFETFFAKAPKPNPSRTLIKGVVCGVRVEAVEEPTMREIRYLDKLVDELAKGKALDKILRKE
jgi:hypothetical protein